ncbi:MAG: DoxX family protein [Anaerolineae bacterium]
MELYAPKSVILIRLLVGLVFFSEGIQKFLFPNDLGVGYFTVIGIPFPQIMASFVGIVEIICGTLLIFGLATRVATIPLLVDIATAIFVTKLPIYFHEGFWSMAHEARVNFCMLLSLLFILAIGPGLLSIDAYIARESHPYQANL